MLPIVPLPGHHALSCLQDRKALAKACGIACSHMLHCEVCQAKLTFQSYLSLRYLCLQDLNELQANAWIYWQAVENGEKGNWWGLMQVSTHTIHVMGMLPSSVLQPAVVRQK